MMDSIETVVIGAGVVGLAVARALALTGQEVLLLESENAIGTGTSSRNSEVIHAGIYYPAGSLKAELCVQGKHMLYAYCNERGIAHRRCGKLIVATHEHQVAQLAGIQAKALANGVKGQDALVMLSQEQAQNMEPALTCAGALWSPSTGIIDSHALMLSLWGDLENAGGLLALNSSLAHVHAQQTRGRQGFILEMQDGTQIGAQRVVNSAGLRAPDLAAKFQGMDPALVPKAAYAKGNYFSLSGPVPFTRLIYPVPELAGLGVHLTLDMAGQAKFGPDVQWVVSPDDLQVDPQRGEAFYAEVRKYWPGLKDGALLPAYAGIRPKINQAHEPAADFSVMGPAEHGVPGLVHLLGIESPGLTSSLALAQRVAQLLA